MKCQTNASAAANGGLGIPTKTVVLALAAAIGALWTYNTKLAYDSAQAQQKTAVILAKMQESNTDHFDRVHNEHLRLLQRLDLMGEGIAAGRARWDKSGKFGSGVRPGP